MEDKLLVTLVQSNLHWEDKNANLAMFEKKIMGLVQRTEIVVLPEMFNTGFSMNPKALAENMEGVTVQWMKRISAEKKIILAGSLIIEENGQYYNRFVWMLPNGGSGFYDKRHRFAYAGEDEHFAAGAKRMIASVKGWRINLQVCYDLRFPVWTRQQAKQGEPEFDVIIYVANWPEKRILAWKTLLQARAIENQCYVVGVNRVGDDGNGIHYNGNSLVVDPLGDILYIKAEDEDIYTLALDKNHLNNTREKFPFLRDSDEFQIKVE